MKYPKAFSEAARAAGLTPEKFAQSIRRLLATGKCRNTGRIFTARLLARIATA